jgi:predicted ATP-dependent protease
MPLSVNAQISFEQTYSGVDGDSASSTELYALLSSLSGVPINQAIAVTGSVDQFGDIQAVGGVTQKIEGWFEVCRERGLTGEQGVIIPADNIDDLMLRTHIISAVSENRFHIWAVQSIDEGLEILTGMAPDNIRGKVRERLERFTEIWSRYRRS